MILFQGPEGRLKSVIRKFFKNVLNKYHFKLIEKRVHSPLGAIYEYRNDVLRLRLVSDKSIVNVDVSSIHYEDFWDVGTIYLLMFLRSKGVQLDKYDVHAHNKSLVNEQEAIILESNMKAIEELYNENNYKKTIKDLNIIGTRRAEVIFGLKRPEDKDS
ncbi:hypothetical protein SAMN04489724_4309 [Algoriphagus locisalis]|uniref:Uncharacterized protein n=1 Tax=Algoriphagus locisalis TaxID=305507 RepID=A0A1I7DQY8_9BACT|nr:hypothetical protein [Algoriphagus locisalis]SFU14046.1 hypothetical protein SAMN04489724_4309 [Algoriphagus locisalis]